MSNSKIQNPFGPRQGVCGSTGFTTKPDRKHYAKPGNGLGFRVQGFGNEPKHEPRKVRTTELNRNLEAYTLNSRRSSRGSQIPKPYSYTPKKPETRRNPRHRCLGCGQGPRRRTPGKEQLLPSFGLWVKGVGFSCLKPLF